MKQSYKITIPKNEKYYIPIKVITSATPAQISLNTKENQILTFYKNKIDGIEYNKWWDNYKKYSNHYELIHVSSMKNKINSNIAYYIPLSRSYFKLLEMIQDFDLLNYKHPIKTAHIAEGPGGFMEAVINYRKNKHYYEDILYGITLKSTEKEIPGWKKSERFLKNNKNVNILYGEDGTGNIYNIKNILHFIDKVGKNSCELVTADGGFDFSIDFNKQEQLAYQLILCQIVMAISVQKLGGSFICKIFDTYSVLTLKLLWLLNISYEFIIITKPLTSRQANSEKYIIGVNFQGIDEHYLNQLYDVIETWDYFNNLKKNKYCCLNDINNNYIIDIFANNVPKKYIETIEKHNSNMLCSQLKNIVKTLEFIKFKDTHDNTNIIREQTKKAIDWCIKYDVIINNKSKYLTDDDKYYIQKHKNKYSLSHSNKKKNYINNYNNLHDALYSKYETSNYRNNNRFNISTTVGKNSYAEITSKNSHFENINANKYLKKKII